MDDWKEVRKRKHNLLECEKLPAKKQPKIDPEIVEISSDDDGDVKEIELSDDRSDLTTSDEDKEDISEAELSDDDTNIKVKPTCAYGSDCYRKNQQHLAEYYHPPKNENPTKASTSGKSIKRTTKTTDVASEATCSESSENEQSSIDNFIKYTKINRLKYKTNSLSLNDILSIDKEKFLESVQFNYCHDIDWTLEQYPNENRNKPLLLVHGPSQMPAIKQSTSKYSNVTLCQAKMDFAYGTHHTKMMILRYKTGMRVVVHTANLIPEDWGLKSQGIWISDLFPRIPDDPATNKNTDSKTFFKSYLKMYLEHYCNPKLNVCIQQIEAHDMSSANVFLIGSIPGRYPANKKLFGHLRLRKILNDHISIDDEKETAGNIICQFSSIGSLGANENSWLCGELYSSLSSQKEAKLGQKFSPICIFPSVSDVRNSFEGYSAGMSIPYSIRVAQKQPYLKKFLYKWKADSNHRTRASPHIKSYARFSEDYMKMYWFLLTSSNLSKAAWGSFEKNKSQLFIRSYEMGVLFIPKFMSLNCTYFDLKSKKFTLPYDLPPVKYNINDKPWCYDVSYQEEDSHGRVWSVGRN